MSHPDEIHGVSQSQFSVARHYGGITFNGAHYTYIPHEDKLVRDDILKARAKAAKDAKKAEKKARDASQHTLIDEAKS